MEKKYISDTHHRITRMYVTFKQNLVGRLIKNRARKFICKKLQVAKVPPPIVILQKSTVRTCIIVKHTCTCISVLSQMGLADHLKPCTQMYICNKS